ncbi:hypothetical protein EYC84_000969 [Monilinia fructicola]|uniref:Uncharacterized protein n=1 Tax=Monilinia fructicola TaxID=38448 RepID=A0A5M9JLQ6_MONFR|nr:hypothetical protein EYC84_000969 [Monilinia fructicola]
MLHLHHPFDNIFSNITKNNRHQTYSHMHANQIIPNYLSYLCSVLNARLTFVRLSWKFSPKLPSPLSFHPSVYTTPSHQSHPIPSHPIPSI